MDRNTKTIIALPTFREVALQILCRFFAMGFVIGFVVTVLVALIGSAKGATVSDALLDALEQVESGGNEHAVGDNGWAIGCLQIHECVVDEVNRLFGWTCDWEYHCFHRETSRAICRAYLQHWGAVYERRHPGKTADDQVLARIWNGGPNGWRKPATLAYWTKVSKHL